jgi:hypothetical protein
VAARIFPGFRPRRRTISRKLAVELWAVGLVGGALLMLALAMNGAGGDARETVGAADAEGGRLAQASNPELKQFMVRIALASAARPASDAPEAVEPRGRARAALPVAPPQAPARSDRDLQRPASDADASAVANLPGAGNSPSPFADKFAL